MAIDSNGSLYAFHQILADSGYRTVETSKPFKDLYGHGAWDAPKGFRRDDGGTDPNQWRYAKKVVDRYGRRKGWETQVLWHPESRKPDWLHSKDTSDIMAMMDERHKYHAGLKASHAQTSSLLARRAERREGHIQRRALNQASRRTMY